MHREFTKAAASSALDKRERVINQLKRFGNLFSQVNDGKPILNMATGQNHELLFKSKLNCLKVGETMYLSFKEERFDNKTLSIFDKLSRTTNITAADEEKNRQKLNMNVAKECQSVQQYISYAELRGFDLRELFKYELSSVPLFLFKNDGSFQKNDQKSQLVNEIFKLFQGNQLLLSAPNADAWVIDFMAYCRKVSVKKSGIESYDDFANHIMKMFACLTGSGKETHIIFDNYRTDSVKNFERIRRAKGTKVEKIIPIPVIIVEGKQKLPATMKSFWPLAENKIQLQQFVIQHYCEKYDGGTPVYLAGAHQNDSNGCLVVENKVVITNTELSCSHEEADDRVIFHVQHLVCERNMSVIIVATEDTDIIISLLYHLINWEKMGLKQLWVNKGTSFKRIVYPLHTLLDAVGRDIVKHLPAIHALSGADTTSKICSKQKILNVQHLYNSLLTGFGTSQLTEEMLLSVEALLVHSMHKYHTASDDSSARSMPALSSPKTFDELRVISYNDYKKSLDLEKMPSSSAALREHIKRAYLQTNMWINSHKPSRDILDHIEDYGWRRFEDHIVPVMLPEGIEWRPHELPDPCTCGVCAFETKCRCRVRKVACCRYCKCNQKGPCKNPYLEKNIHAR